MTLEQESETIKQEIESAVDELRRKHPIRFWWEMRKVQFAAWLYRCTGIRLDI